MLLNDTLKEVLGGGGDGHPKRVRLSHVLENRDHPAPAHAKALKKEHPKDVQRIRRKPM